MYVSLVCMLSLEYVVYRISLRPKSQVVRELQSGHVAGEHIFSLYSISHQGRYSEMFKS